ncbi:sulfotransferase family protein [Lysobacter koreensis]|uniref:Sulfotransferase family protein n=1 Tax=Lysobacter koreensis TaxID=266122 RepID=A0ABW2YPU0_9GAMM
MSAAAEPAAILDRPVFIVASPRSGASLLFDTLMRAPKVYSAGAASHQLLEGIDGLHVRARGFDSNRLLAADATPAVAAELARRFDAAARDRDGAPPQRLPFRLLDKTPKHSLRVPFLAQAFPDAQFVYLYRDPRQVLANMLLAWASGKFRTYAGLPGWPRDHWALLLTPGWRALAGKPLADIVAGQWQAATDVLLADLEALAPQRWRVLRYDDFLANPSGEIARLCLALDYGWDRPLNGGVPTAAGEQPTAEDAEVVRRHAADLQRLWPGLQATADRAARLAGL